MEKKLIAIDLDGTALNSYSKIDYETEKVLKKAKTYGHIIVIITGRPNALSIKYYDQLSLDTPMINFNGSLGYIPHNNWINEYEITFNKNIVFDILKNKKKFDIKVVAAEGKNFALADIKNNTLNGYFPSGTNSSEILNKINLKKNPTSMILLVNNKIKSALKLEKFFGDKINVNVWGGKEQVIEISPKGINKKYGIHYIAKYFNIDRKNILAFGDEHNDIEMLKFAGWGVAMKNATTEIKQIANDITQFDNNHNGLAYYIKNYLKLI